MLRAELVPVALGEGAKAALSAWEYLTLHKRSLNEICEDSVSESSQIQNKSIFNASRLVILSGFTDPLRLEKIRRRILCCSNS